MYYYLPVKYVIESRRNSSVHLSHSHRPGMGEEELQDERINKSGENQRRARMKSVARGQLWATRKRLCPTTNILACFRPKWRLSSLLSFKSFSQRAQFWKLGNIIGYVPVLAGEYFGHVTSLDQSHAGENIWWNFINNYSPKWKWLTMDIYRAATRRGKYWTLATDTEVNSCSVY